MGKVSYKWRNIVLFTFCFNVVLLLQYTLISVANINQGEQTYTPHIDGKQRNNIRKFGVNQKMEVNDPKLDANSKQFKLNPQIAGHNEDNGSPGPSYIRVVRHLAERVKQEYGHNHSAVVNAENNDKYDAAKNPEGGELFLMKPHLVQNNNVNQAVLLSYNNNNTLNSIKQLKLEDNKSKNNVYTKNSKHSAEKQAPTMFYSNVSFAKNAEELQLEEIYYKKGDKVVNKFNHTYVIQPKKPKCHGDIFLVMLVHSKPNYHDRRDAIRKSWGSLADTNTPTWPPDKPLGVKVTLIFVTGLDKTKKWNDLLAVENDMYGDVLQGDFMDDYKNMTLKSLLGLKYVSEHCASNVPYMLKSDDDMFINIPFLIQTLQEKLLDRSIMGPFNAHSKVYRKGKWALTKEVYPFNWFPPYESGSAYVITVDIVKDLYEASQYMPWIFIDDVYITGILARVIGAKHEYRVKMFSYWTDKAPLPCDIITNKKITFTKCTPVLLGKLWGSLEQRNKC